MKKYARLLWQDLDGPGEDYKGRFTIALFGETAPMTVMNFAAITRGYKRGPVRILFVNSSEYVINNVGTLQQQGT